MACTSQNPPNAKNLNKKITPLSFLLSIDNGRCYCSSQSAIVAKRDNDLTSTAYYRSYEIHVKHCGDGKSGGRWNKIKYEPVRYEKRGKYISTSTATTSGYSPYWENDAKSIRCLTAMITKCVIFKIKRARERNVPEDVSLASTALLTRT